MSVVTTPFSAGPSTLGYLFQCRYALYESLRRLPTNEEFSVSIETLDDVVFEPNGTPLELLQIKHHIKKSTNLTDASPDLWKSIRIWCEELKKKSIPTGTLLFLITTQQLNSGSAAYYLSVGQNRDAAKAIERLNATAQSSTSTTNEQGYNLFRALSIPEKNSLFNSVYIMGSAPSIEDLNDEFRKVLYYTTKTKFLDSLINRIEGWWLKRVIEQLTTVGSKVILSEEIDAEVSLLREQLHEENLPIDDDIMRATVDASGYANDTFVQQLQLIGIGNNRIYHAIRNYFRAFEHRSRWAREDLLIVGELSRYEDRLIEEWELHFDQMHDELGDFATEEMKKVSAQNLYKWIETGQHPIIRRYCIEPAISRGSYQMLANARRVGWHPEFAQRIQQLLDPVASEATS